MPSEENPERSFLKAETRSAEREVDMQDNQYSTVQKTAFRTLVEDGVYDAQFTHAPAVRKFFHDVLNGALQEMGAGRSISLLDCGCGPGAWLKMAWDVASSTGKSHLNLFGFDITPEMIPAARERLTDFLPADHLKVGDILDAESYEFPGHGKHFDIIFAYDVIQQLPKRLQFQACETMASHLSPNGAVLIFDHEAQSLFGRKMALKKFVTQYLKVELVPPYYCNAKYPPLAKFAARLLHAGAQDTEIKKADHTPKRCLLIRAKTRP